MIDFDHGSGSFLERILFNNRPIILLLGLLLTIFFGFEATNVKLNASFEKMIPSHQPFIVHYFQHYQQLQSNGNAVSVVVQANHGTILNAHYLEILKQINDKVYLLPDVARPFVKSLWTPAV